MRQNLHKSKDWLQCKRFDMLHLWIKSIQLKEMNRILEAVLVGPRYPSELPHLDRAKINLILQ